MEREIQEARRAALCKRLRETGFQDGEPCDGVTVVCGCCERTLRAIDEAARDANRTLANQAMRDDYRYEQEFFNQG